MSRIEGQQGGPPVPAGGDAPTPPEARDLADEGRRFAARLDPSPERGPSERPLRPPSDEPAPREVASDTLAADRFMQQRERAQGRSSGPEIAPEPPVQAAGDAILRNLMGAPPPEPAHEPVPPARIESTLSEIARAVADRILVGDAGASGGPEVRIALRENVMPGTELRISDAGDTLRVEMATLSDVSFDRLSEQRDGLLQQLEARLGRPVEVAVMRAGGSGTSGDPGEGRSRDRRSPADEIAEGEE